MSRAADLVGSAEFTIAWSGPAVDEGRMPVRELAPALLSLAEIVQEANSVADDGGAAVSLDISSSGRRASFDVELVLWATASVLVSNPITAASNVVTLTTTSLDLLRRFRGRPVERRALLPPDQTRITLSDGTEITAERQALVVVEREAFRTNAVQLLQPLQRDGVDYMRIYVDGRPEPQLEVSSDDAATVAAGPSASNPVLEMESENTLPLALVSPSFAEDNKWRLTDQLDHTDWYEMLDAEFVKRIGQHEVAFRKGDSLVCRVRTQRWRAVDGKVIVERQIVEVLAHVPPPEEPLLLDPIS
ncbi:MAG: hypothetical protein WA809_04945 [Candidatus Dormiibacterota bacterium]